MAGSENYPLGREALRSGDYEKARQYFESALSDSTNTEESVAGLLSVLRETGAFQEAANRADEFLSTRDSSALLHLERGRIAEAVGDYAGAEKHFRRTRTLAPEGSELRMDATRLLAELLEEVGRRSEAQPFWNQLIEEYRAGLAQGSRRLGAVAVAAWRQGYDEDARDLFMDATDPNLGVVSLETLSNFGFLFLEKYNAAVALDVFKDCLKINKSYPDALIGMALAKKYESDFEVETYARAALKVNPNLVPALNILAELAMEEESYEAALMAINAALAVNPASLDSLSLKAVYYHFYGDEPSFAKIEKRILEINPSYGKLYYTLAENLVSRRKYQEAVDFSRKAIALDPKLWPAYTILGMNLTRIGNWEEGRTVIQQAFEGDPYNVWAYNFLDLLDQMKTFVHSRSEHFSFLMSKEDHPVLSSYARDLAEEAYAKLTQRYGFKPSGPLQIEIFPDHGGLEIRTLGLPELEGALGVCFGKVVAIDSPGARKDKPFNWGTALWHEFAHVISLQMTNYNIPRWYSEGLSGHEERRARPGWGDNLTASFIKAYKEGKLLKLSELNAGIIRPRNPEQIVHSYYQAALACEWIEERFGFEKIKQSLLLFSENKPAREVFRQTLGLDTAEMDAEFARFIDSRVKDISSRLNFARPDAVPGEQSHASPDKKTLALLLERNPEDFFINLQMGARLRKEGANSEAEVYLKKAQALFPQYAEEGNPYQLLAEIYLESQREDQALAEFLAWSRMDSGAREPLLKAAEIFRKRKDWASAMEMLHRSVYINPYDLDVLKGLGEAAMESGKWPAAIASYRVLVSLNDLDKAGAHYDLARALLASGNKLEAKRETLRALEVAPSFIKAQRLLLELSGDPVE